MRARGAGEGMSVDYNCKDCSGLAAGLEVDGQWNEHEVTRSDALGVHVRRAASQEDAHKRVKQLNGKVGRFIIVQAREGWSAEEKRRPGHFWLARTVESLRGSGTCIVKKVEARGETIHNTK